ncbi:MAG: hypothetical protein ACTSYS_14035 [Promethearchaeota archaeon]
MLKQDHEDKVDKVDLAYIKETLEATCPLCGRTYVGIRCLSHLAKHVKNYHERYLCYYCGIIAKGKDRRSHKCVVKKRIKNQRRKDGEN